MFRFKERYDFLFFVISLEISRNLKESYFEIFRSHWEKYKIRIKQQDPYIQGLFLFISFP